LGFDVVQHLLQQEPVVFAEAAGHGFTQVRDLVRIRPLANSASAALSLWPAISAPIMA